MFYAILIFALFFLSYAPTLWVKYVLWKHSKPIKDMPGTGSELATHLIDRFELHGVSLKKGGKGEDFYSPEDKTVSLSPEVYEGKSLTAVAVAAHEIGHAIQFYREEPVSKLRSKYLGKAFQIRRFGSIIIMSAPFITLIIKSPAVMIALILIGVLTMLVSVSMYAAILPEDYDASFKKALPILDEGYVPKQHISAIRSVLKACALTYVAAALADVLNLWRWIRFLR